MRRQSAVPGICDVLSTHPLPWASMSGDRISGLRPPPIRAGVRWAGASDRSASVLRGCGMERVKVGGSTGPGDAIMFPCDDPTLRTAERSRRGRDAMDGMVRALAAAQGQGCGTCWPQELERLPVGPIGRMSTERVDFDRESVERSMSQPSGCNRQAGNRVASATTIRTDPFRPTGARKSGSVQPARQSRPRRTRLQAVTRRLPLEVSSGSRRT